LIGHLVSKSALGRACGQPEACASTGVLASAAKIANAADTSVPIPKFASIRREF
jgi:hypothetical protein